MINQISDSNRPPEGERKTRIIKLRISIGTLLLVLVAGMFWFDAHLSSKLSAAPLPQGTVNWQGLLLGGGLVSAVAALLVLATAQEMIHFCRAAGTNPAGGLAVLFAPLLSIHPWIAANISGLTTDTLGLIILTVALIGSVVAIMVRRQSGGAIQNIATTYMSIAYVGLLAAFLVRIRQEVPGPLGAWVVLWVIAVVKFTDIFAYGTGMLIGRHKLIPWLSPGKTWEGLVGGLTGAGIIAVSLLYVSVIIPIDGIRPDIAPATYVAVGLMGALIGAVGQLGDLMESLMKRGAGCKDSASLLPGFGGVFDLLDSPLLAGPAAYVVVRWMLWSGLLRGFPVVQ